MKTIAMDTETFLIGPGAVAPKMVCCSFATLKGSDLVGNGDPEVDQILRMLFKPGHMLVGHNTAYDTAVLAMSYPEIEELIWAKYAAGEITCTRVQEQLINLGTHGKLEKMRLPDGSSKHLLYNLAVLEKKYLSIDRSAQKEGDNIWRLNYHTLDGKKSSEYPPDARGYAIEDAEGTLGVHLQQVNKAPEGCLDVAPFHAWADFALFMITIRGMAIDKEQVEKVRAELAEELNPEKMQPLVDAGIIRPGTPVRPHSRSIPKALKSLEAMAYDLGEVPPEMDEKGPVGGWAPYQEYLEEEGFKFTKPTPPTVDKKALTRLVEELCKEYGMPIKLTAKEQTSTDVEVLQDLEGKSPIIDLYRERQSLQKLVTTELPRMEWQGEVADVVHFPFRALLETGRTSSYANKLFPSGNGQQLHPKIRPCYKARDGFVLLSVDYSTLELATLGQRMTDIFGKSVHADKINAGVDLHAFLAAQLANALWPEFRDVCAEVGALDVDSIYEIFMELKTAEDEALRDKFDWWRKFSKPVGLGYPGALGPWTFLGFAKKSYGVDVGKIAMGLPQELFKINKRVLALAKRHLGMSNEDFVWNSQTRALALAYQLKELWLETFQMRPYYEYIQKNHRDSINPIIGERDNGDPVDGYSYISDFGMIRRGCSYSACCNGVGMQTPAAEGAKLAVINTVRACRDQSQNSILCGNAHVVDFVHDELLLEVKEIDPQHLDHCAKEVSLLMLEAMEFLLPDIPGLKTEGVFMRVWDKKAKPSFDDEGRLIVTERKED